MSRNIVQVDPDKFPWLDLRRYTFSMGTEKDGLVYVSGQTASVYDTEEGRVRCKGDIVEQAKVAWEKIGVVLEAAGLSYDNIVRTVDYIAPAGLPKFRHTGAVQEQFMGKSPVASTSVLVHSLLRPDALIEVNAIAAKGNKEAIIPPGPEFERFKQLTYVPAVRVENKLWLTGLIEPEPDDTVGQAARCYERMDKALSAAGASFQDVIHTMNYIDPQARVHYADTRKERERRFKGTYPASSGVIFHGMLSPPRAPGGRGHRGDGYAPRADHPSRMGGGLPRHDRSAGAEKRQPGLHLRAGIHRSSDGGKCRAQVRPGGAGPARLQERGGDLRHRWHRYRRHHVYAGMHTADSPERRARSGSGLGMPTVSGHTAPLATGRQFPRLSSLAHRTIPCPFP